ncbi:hypothetical protein ARSEF4850_000654 [Beauveria asiatica]
MRAAKPKGRRRASVDTYTGDPRLARHDKRRASDSKWGADFGK